MHIEIIDTGIDCDRIINEVKEITKNTKATWGAMSQLGFQGREPNMKPEDHTEITGKMNSLMYPENYYKYKMFESCTYINSLIDKYNLVRTRLMVLDSKACLSWHKDMTKRIHIPVVSGEGSIMVIEDRAYNLEPGNVYLTNTTLPHTAVNAANLKRVHIMGCLYE